MTNNFREITAVMPTWLECIVFSRKNLKGVKTGEFSSPLKLEGLSLCLYGQRGCNER
jgi:hypothetical protein